MTDVIVSYSPGFDDLLIHEIKREHTDAEWRCELVPGVGVIAMDVPFATFAATWMAHPPIYIQHIFPRMVELSLAGSEDDLEVLREAYQAHIMPYEGRLMSIQTRLLTDEHSGRLPDAAEELVQLPYSARDVAKALRPLIEGQGIRLRRKGEQVLSLVIHRSAEGFSGHMGLSMVGQNVSPWAGGQMPVYMDLPSRAGKKLVEALATFDLALPDGAQALDLGAAPGGWTKVLVAQGIHVTAVDQAEMDAQLLRDPLVAWRRRTAEEYLNTDEGPFDLIVNDMIMDAQDSARLMVDYAPKLKVGAYAIMTLKLRSQNRRRVMDHSFRLLRPAYDIVRVRQLYYNRHEVTLLLRRK